MNDRHAALGPDDEREVDLASAWERVKARWWLPVGGLVLGAVVGIALALSGGTVWRAETIVYLGQPFAPQGGGQIQSLATNPRTVARSSAPSPCSRTSPTRPGSRSRSCARPSRPRSSTIPGQLRGINPLMEIGVKGDAGPRASKRRRTRSRSASSRTSRSS